MTREDTGPGTEWREFLAVDIEVGLRKGRWRFRSDIAGWLRREYAKDGEDYTSLTTPRIVDDAIAEAESSGRWPVGWVDSLIPRQPPGKPAGRAIPGQAWSNGKLTDQQIAEIRRRWPLRTRPATHTTMTLLAREFGVSRARIKVITSGQPLGRGKLTVDEVREIRRRWSLRGFAATRTTLSALGREFGVSGTQIRRIVARKRWGHV